MRNVLVLSSILIISLGGCSSTTPPIETAQYCYTDEKIVYDKNNQVVSNDTVVECSMSLNPFCKRCRNCKKTPIQTVANIRGTQKCMILVHDAAGRLLTVYLLSTVCPPGPIMGR